MLYFFLPKDKDIGRICRVWVGAQGRMPMSETVMERGEYVYLKHINILTECGH